MTGKTVARIFDFRTIILYLIAYLLLFATAAGKTSMVDLFGGFSACQNRGMLNVFAIMRWNLCVLPPVAASVLYMVSELGAFSRYSVLRYKTLKHWYFVRIAAVVAVNLAYLLAFFLFTEFSGLNAGCDRALLLHLLFVFPAHTVLLSVISVTLLAVCRSAKIPMMVFLAVEGFLVLAGTFFPQASRFLPPFWAMARNDSLLLPDVGWNVCLVVCITDLAVCFLLSATVKWLQSHNPAAAAKNQSEGF